MGFRPEEKGIKTFLVRSSIVSTAHRWDSDLKKKGLRREGEKKVGSLFLLSLSNDSTFLDSSGGLEFADQQPNRRPQRKIGVGAEDLATELAPSIYPEWSSVRPASDRRAWSYAAESRPHLARPPRGET